MRTWEDLDDLLSKEEEQEQEDDDDDKEVNLNDLETIQTTYHEILVLVKIGRAHV